MQGVRRLSPRSTGSTTTSLELLSIHKDIVGSAGLVERLHVPPWPSPIARVARCAWCRPRRSSRASWPPRDGPPRQEHDPDPVPRAAARGGRLVRPRGHGHGAVVAGAGVGDRRAAGRAVVPRLAGDIVRSMADGPVTLEHRDGEGVVNSWRGIVVLAQLSPGRRLPASPGRRGQRPRPAGRRPGRHHRPRRPCGPRDETRPVLTGVLLRLAPDGLTMVATDSYRLAVRHGPRGAAAGRARGDHPGARPDRGGADGAPAPRRGDRGGADRDPGALPGRGDAPDEPPDRRPVPGLPPAGAGRLRARGRPRPRRAAGC